MSAAAVRTVAADQLLGCFEDPAILLAEDFEILAANDAYRERFGDRGSLEGEKCFRVSHHFADPCDDCGEVCPVRLALETGERQRVLHVHYTRDGEEHEEVTVEPLGADPDGRRMFVEILRPLTIASARSGQRRMVGQSAAFREMLEMLELVAPTSSTVLLLGESGTGKELAARAVHEMSGRTDGPLVPVDCSGLSESLFESELFGHARGAFTGAVRDKPGLVEDAEGGTLFLDEIGDIPLSLQVKLLRLLETGVHRRVGSLRQRRADFRLVCATHRDLRRMIDEGNFRADLYYRITAFPVRVPALRDRLDDLPLITECLLERLSATSRTMSEEAIAILQRYTYPGNIRELRNILERAALLARGGPIEPEHLPDLPHGDDRSRDPFLAPCTGSRILPLGEVEALYLRRIAGRFRGDRAELARRLQVSERTLYRKLRRLQP